MCPINVKKSIAPSWMNLNYIVIVIHIKLCTDNINNGNCNNFKCSDGPPLS